VDKLVENLHVELVVILRGQYLTQCHHGSASTLSASPQAVLTTVSQSEEVTGCCALHTHQASGLLRITGVRSSLIMTAECFNASRRFFWSRARFMSNASFWTTCKQKAVSHSACRKVHRVDRHAVTTVHLECSIECFLLLVSFWGCH